LLFKKESITSFDWEYSKVKEIDACETGEDVYNVIIVEEVIPDAL